MAEYFTVRDFKVGDFKDDNGNVWCNVVFEEQSSTQHRWVVKDPTTVHLGQKVYGHIEEKMSKANKPYTRFYRDKEPEEPTYTKDGDQSAQGKPSTDESIARAVALKAAVEWGAYGLAGNKIPTGVDVLKEANIFLAWLKQESPLGTMQTAPPVTHETTPATHQAEQAPNPKRPWENRKPAVDPELASLEETGMPFEGRHYLDFDEEGNPIR